MRYVTTTSNSPFTIAGSGGGDPRPSSDYVSRAEYTALLNRVIALESKLNRYSDVTLQISDGSSTTTTKYLLGRD